MLIRNAIQTTKQAKKKHEIHLKMCLETHIIYVDICPDRNRNTQISKLHKRHHGNNSHKSIALKHVSIHRIDYFPLSSIRVKPTKTATFTVSFIRKLESLAL